MRRFSKSMVPRGDVKRMVDDQIDARIETMKWQCDAKVSELQEMVDDFESASGVELKKRWDGGRIGDAVTQISKYYIPFTMSHTMYFTLQ